MTLNYMLLLSMLLARAIGNNVEMALAVAMQKLNEELQSKQCKPPIENKPTSDTLPQLFPPLMKTTKLPEHYEPESANFNSLIQYTSLALLSVALVCKCLVLPMVLKQQKKSPHPAANRPSKS